MIRKVIRIVIMLFPLTLLLSVQYLYMVLFILYHIVFIYESHNILFKGHGTI